MLSLAVFGAHMQFLGVLDLTRDAWIHRVDWISSGIHIGSGRKYKDSYYLQAQATAYINPWKGKEQLVLGEEIGVQLVWENCGAAFKCYMWNVKLWKILLAKNIMILIYP